MTQPTKSIFWRKLYNSTTLIVRILRTRESGECCFLVLYREICFCGIKHGIVQGQNRYLTRRFGSYGYL